MPFINNPHRLSRLLLSALIFLVVFFLAVTSLVQKSPTFDEQGFIVRGLAYLRPPEEGGTRAIHVGHPPGLNAYNALLLTGDETVNLPVDDPSWQGTSFHRPAELFMWEIGNDVAHIMFLARLQTVWLGLLLIALLARWAAEMASGGIWLRQNASQRLSRNIAGVLTLLIVAFDPNLMAHMRLATTDFGLTATAALAAYGLWRLVRRPSYGSAALAGVGLGLALNTKFTAVLFLPFFGVVILLGLVFQWRSKSFPPENFRKVLLQTLLIYPLTAVIVLWAGTGFDVGALPEGLPFLPQLAGWHVPLAGYLEQLLDIGGRLEVETPAFLLGQYRTTGWWTYFPVTFMLKTPLPTLALIGLALTVMAITLWRKRREVNPSDILDLLVLFLPAAGFFAIALTTEINLGYRHILPVLPFLFVFTGASLGPFVAENFGASTVNKRAGKVIRWTIGGLVGAVVAISLWIYPHYLAYFNVLAGGPNGGWRALVDSNIDWGQDLQALEPWMEAQGVERVWLSYFGEARPEYYGIRYDGLDSFPPRLMDPAARPFFPDNPAPGWYAISATNLQGVHFDNHDEFDYFRQREPDGKLGYSIFLYEVSPRGEPVNLLLNGMQPDEIAPADYEKLGTNDVTIRWFDGRQALLLPQNGQASWLVSSADSPLAEQWSEILDGAEEIAGSADAYSIYAITESRLANQDDAVTFSSGEAGIDLLLPAAINRGGPHLELVTTWQQLGEPVPINIFIHVVDESGTIVAQWDGLGAAWQGWRNRDVLHQLHEIDLPAELLPGSYRIVAGLYDPQTLIRWQLPDSQDAIELGQFVVPES
ncbi:MAG: phospholipid carrier-dependent glycosyltransferase [Chloroflexota bacterium]